MTFLKPAWTAAGAAITACLSMAATPAFAANLPPPRPAAVVAYDAQAGNANGWRHRRYRDDGIDAGDVIAGILIIGGIAAIASAASRDRDEPRRRYPADPGYRSRDDRYDSSGIGRAVDMCVAEIERGRERVANIDNAARDASGWRVSGELEGGDSFTCRIGSDGHIRDVDISYRDRYDSIAYGDAADRAIGDRQYSDDVYDRARAGQPSVDHGDAFDDDMRPAYPGGPLPGEDGDDEHQHDNR